jgi:hypothetical protein
MDACTALKRCYSVSDTMTVDAVPKLPMGMLTGKILPLLPAGEEEVHARAVTNDALMSGWVVHKSSVLVESENVLFKKTVASRWYARILVAAEEEGG